MKRALFIGSRLEACQAYFKFLANDGYAVDIATLQGTRIATTQAFAKDAVIFEPKKSSALRELHACLADRSYLLVLSAGFPYILPPATLAIPGITFLNSHPHLLPENKGINVIRESFERREILYGATTHYMSAAVDDGEIIARQEIVLQPTDLSLIYEFVFGFVEPATILQALCRLKRQEKIG